MSDDNDDKNTRSASSPLADQLADLDIEVSDEPAEEPSPSPPEPDADSATPDAGERATTADDEALSGDELFRQAFEDLSAGDIPPDGDPGPDPYRDSRPQHHPPDDAKPPPDGDGSDVDDERELFEQAVQDIDPARIYDAKFRGQAGADLPAEAEPTLDGEDVASSASDGLSSSDHSEEQTRRQARQLRDDALFKKSVGSVTPLEDRDKYHHARRRPPSRPADEKSARDVLLTPLLPKSGEGLNQIAPLDHSQRALLDRHKNVAASQDVPELHIRGLHRKDALSQLAEFVAGQAGADAQFLRIIHGRGLRSELDPILKPAVLHWLEGPGLTYIRGYAPERTRVGDYGSLIVELKRRGQ